MRFGGDPHHLTENSPHKGVRIIENIKLNIWIGQSGYRVTGKFQKNQELSPQQVKRKPLSIYMCYQRKRNTLSNLQI